MALVQDSLNGRKLDLGQAREKFLTSDTRAKKAREDWTRKEIAKQSEAPFKGYSKKFAGDK